MSDRYFDDVRPVNRWMTFLARCFGKRLETTDSGYVLVCYLWRGRLYATEFREGSGS